MTRLVDIVNLLNRLNNEELDEIGIADLSINEFSDADNEIMLTVEDLQRHTYAYKESFGSLVEAANALEYLWVGARLANGKEV